MNDYPDYDWIGSKLTDALNRCMDEMSVTSLCSLFTCALDILDRQEEQEASA